MKSTLLALSLLALSAQAQTTYNVTSAPFVNSYCVALNVQTDSDPIDYAGWNWAGNGSQSFSLHGQLWQTAGYAAPGQPAQFYDGAGHMATGTLSFLRFTTKQCSGRGGCHLVQRCALNLPSSVTLP